MVMAVVLSPSLGAASPEPRAAEAVARSLGSLVRATVEGVVREAIIIGSAQDDLGPIAHHAGCALVETNSFNQGLLEAVARSRSDVAFVLTGGFIPQIGFIEEASDFLLSAACAEGAAMRREPDSLLTRVAPGFAEPVGAFAPCAALRTAAPRDLKELIRRLRIRRVFRVRAHKVV
jgi:hypothetical protein